MTGARLQPRHQPRRLRHLPVDDRRRRGEADEELDGLAASASRWESGGQPDGLPLVEADRAPPKRARDVFVFFISGAKERAPAAAMALIERLS